MQNRYISADYGLNEKERNFVRIFLAFRETNAAEAYRRSHLKQAPSSGKWVDPPEGRDPNSYESFPAWDRTKVSRAAQALLKEQRIQDYLSELKRPTPEAARQRLREAVVLGEGKEARDAAALIMKDEDRFGAADAARMWQQIMVESGAEIELVLPEFVEARLLCPHCDRFADHQVRVALSAPIAEMFPVDAPPPPIVIPEIDEGEDDFDYAGGE